MKKILFVFFLAFLAVGTAASAQLDPPEPSLILELPNTPEAWFGFSVDGSVINVQGENYTYFAIGAPDDDDERGAVHIYKCNEQSDCEYVRAINAPSVVEIEDGFGTQVKMQGETLIVSTFRTNFNNYARIFVFERMQGGEDNWGLIQEIPTPPSPNNTFFGFDFDIDQDSGELLAITAQGISKAFVYRRSDEGQYRLETELFTTDVCFPHSPELGPCKIGFGTQVIFIDSQTIAISQGGAITPVSDNAGKVYIFKKTPFKWQEDQILYAQDGQSNDIFGYDLAADNNTLVVGAFRAQDTRGALYIFERDEKGEWQENQKLTAADATPNSFLGYSISIHDNRIISGTVLHNNQRGAAYVFYKSNGQWAEEFKLEPTHSNDPGRWFGESVYVDSNYMLVGMPDGNNVGNEFDSGVSYLYVAPDIPSILGRE